MSVSRYLIASVCGGLLFGLLDGLINANPLAARLNAYLRPIARERIPVAAGILIDLAWGFAMAAIFLLLRSAFPGQSMLVKGLAFAALAWFFRVLMRAASDAVMLKVSAAATAYTVASGALEMGLIGLLLGLLLS
jgi:hypothetical protein